MHTQEPSLAASLVCAGRCLGILVLVNCRLVGPVQMSWMSFKMQATTGLPLLERRKQPWVAQKQSRGTQSRTQLRRESAVLTACHGVRLQLLFCIDCQHVFICLPFTAVLLSLHPLLLI